MKTTCSVLIMLAIGYLATPVPAAAGNGKPFKGNWVLVYPCKNATGLYAERCHQGARDMFSLYDLTQVGAQLCGYHLATAHLGNRVDEGDLSGNGPSIYGVVHGNVARIRFRSGRTGEIGHATLTRKADTLVWHVTKPLQRWEESWIPNDAVLRKDRRQPHPHELRCTQAPTTRSPVH